MPQIEFDNVTIGNITGLLPNSTIPDTDEFDAEFDYVIRNSSAPSNQTSSSLPKIEIIGAAVAGAVGFVALSVCFYKYKLACFAKMCCAICNCLFVSNNDGTSESTSLNYGLSPEQREALYDEGQRNSQVRLI